VKTNFTFSSFLYIAVVVFIIICCYLGEQRYSFTEKMTTNFPWNFHPLLTALIHFSAYINVSVSCYSSTLLYVLSREEFQVQHIFLLNLLLEFFDHFSPRNLSNSSTDDFSCICNDNSNSIFLHTLPILSHSIL